MDESRLRGMTDDEFWLCVASHKGSPGCRPEEQADSDFNTDMSEGGPSLSWQPLDSSLCGRIHRV